MMESGLPNSLHDLLESVFEEGYERAFKRSWFTADRTERKHRIKYVALLSAELEKIRAVDIFGTGLGEGAIEQLIEGNYDEMMQYCGDFAFDDEADVRARYAPLWKRFRELLTEAYERRPGQVGATLQ